MKKTILVILIIIASVVVVRAFYMPWARISTSVVKISEEVASVAEDKLFDIPEVKKAIKGLKKATDVINRLGDVEIKTAVSGYDIPRMVNQKSSKTAISVAEMLFDETKDLDKKSYLVYLLPLSAVLCAALALAGLKFKPAAFPILVLSGGISITGLYKLKNTDLSTLSVSIVIEQGLWYTLYAFLFIFFMSILYILVKEKEA
ncbi:MAG: hypothetical protein ISS34_01800 [Candidatus Omnitrophica bacterium]|nr:hypothetical protein [Candidatus Omnitrophota bacterium]